MSSYYNGSQEREWPGSEQDPEWCYYCDRPKNDCACEPAEIDSREATEFATLTAKYGVGIVMEAPRLTYGTLGPQSGLSKQIWKLTGDKCSPAQYMLEFSEPWAARRKAIEIMRNIDRIGRFEQDISR